MTSKNKRYLVMCASLALAVALSACNGKVEQAGAETSKADEGSATEDTVETDVAIQGAANETIEVGN